MRIVRPDEKTLTSLFQNRMESILIVSPYISPGGIQMLLKVFTSHACKTEKMEFWIRLSPEDHANGLTDYHTLLKFLKIVKNQLKTKIEVRHCEKLHAKIYMTPNLALVGSANLTSNGFGSNVEAVVLLDRSDEIELLRNFVKDTRRFFARLRIEDLESFCKELPKFGIKPTISEVEKDSIDIEDIFKGPPHYKLPGLR